ncbi:class I SAM-dependent methyltransferase [Rhizobium sp. 2MFCol3.1]|uniref:SAM-dependent methyltransferase n=1 Tax=Rhizobium sp. 2MFCol3.1 TaxID=1246459 RepID=UPI00037674BC|nr:class I SAM-dependent methyltransferase [Rhizobium sp. 2MFCol3.1]
MDVAAARNLFVNSDRSLAARIRLKRWDMMLALMPDLPKMKILDLGGTREWWLRAPIQPPHVTVVNLDIDEQQGRITAIRGDACKADQLFGDERFDLVFSNSLIEHVGGHHSFSQLAEVTRKMAPRYLVQTPYRYFPIEPHWLFPGMQFMPMALRVKTAEWWPLGHTWGWPQEQTFGEVLSTQLLTATEMKRYFPDAKIHWERFMGLPKSMIAIR